jgi:hypothetical protein
VRNLLRTRPQRSQGRSRHKLSRQETNRTLINPVLSNPKLKTSPANPMTTLRQENLDVLATAHACIAEMGWVLDARIGLDHTAFDFTG